MANGLVDYLNDLRYVEVSNAGASTIPAFGLMRVTGASTTNGLALTVDQPNADGQDVLINGPTPIIAGGRGVATYETPSQIYYDTGDGTPANGETWGAGSGSYKLKKNKAGFTIQGGAANELVVAGRADQTGSGGTFNLTVRDDTVSVGSGGGTLTLSPITTIYTHRPDGLRINTSVYTVGTSVELGIFAAAQTQQGAVSLAGQVMGSGTKTFDAILVDGSFRSTTIFADLRKEVLLFDCNSSLDYGEGQLGIHPVSVPYFPFANPATDTVNHLWASGNNGTLTGGCSIYIGSHGNIRFDSRVGNIANAYPYTTTGTARDTTLSITTASGVKTGVYDTLADGTVVCGGLVVTKGTTTISVSSGGTGLTSVTENGILIGGSGGSSVATTSAGSQYNVLTVDASSVPLFGQVALDQSAAVTGTLAVGNGGTGSTSVTENGVMFGGSGGTSVSATSAGSQYNVLTVNGSNTPVFGQVALDQSAAVTGELPGANVAAATTTTRGAVEMADAVADPASLTTTETADSTYDSTEEDMLNHLKADVTEIRTQLAALLSSLRSAGVLDT